MDQSAIMSSTSVWKYNVKLCFKSVEVQQIWDDLLNLKNCRDVAVALVNEN